MWKHRKLATLRNYPFLNSKMDFKNSLWGFCVTKLVRAISESKLSESIILTTSFSFSFLQILPISEPNILEGSRSKHALSLMITSYWTHQHPGGAEIHRLMFWPETFPARLIKSSPRAEKNLLNIVLADFGRSGEFSFFWFVLHQILWQGMQ